MMGYNVCSPLTLILVLIEVYLKLLGDPYWRGQALDAILVWYVFRRRQARYILERS